MLPDQKPVTPSTSMPASLPQVNFQAPVQPIPGPSPQQAATTPDVPSGQDSTEISEKVRLLTTQYGANPYAFAMAFQQLKARYLLDHYHIDPNMEKH